MENSKINWKFLAEFIQNTGSPIKFDETFHKVTFDRGARKTSITGVLLEREFHINPDIYLVPCAVLYKPKRYHLSVKKNRYSFDVSS